MRFGRREAAEAEKRESYEHRMPADWLEALAPLGTDRHKEFLESAPYLIVVFRMDSAFRGRPRTARRRQSTDQVDAVDWLFLVENFKQPVSGRTT